MISIYGAVLLKAQVCISGSRLGSTQAQVTRDKYTHTYDINLASARLLATALT